MKQLQVSSRVTKFLKQLSNFNSEVGLFTFSLHKFWSPICWVMLMSLKDFFPLLILCMCYCIPPQLGVLKIMLKILLNPYCFIFYHPKCIHIVLTWFLWWCSPVNPVTNVVPLSLVLLVSLIKEAFEDWVSVIHGCIGLQAFPLDSSFTIVCLKNELL